MRKLLSVIVAMSLGYVLSGAPCIHFRNNLNNSLYAISVEKKATVAFLGGSITEMTGWRNMVQEDLLKRFPDTEFTFIDAGIPSLGSTPPTHSVSSRTYSTTASPTCFSWKLL